MDEEEAVALVVNGFCRDVLQALPMEFAMEAQRWSPSAGRVGGMTDARTHLRGVLGGGIVARRMPGSTDTAMPAIKVFYWKGKNFGDALSRDVVAHVSGREAVWAPPLQADLFAVGSVVSLIGDHFANAPDDTTAPLHVGQRDAGPARRASSWTG